MSAEELEPVGNSPKKPLPYDYYNPATWLVDSPESEEVVNQQEAKITDDIFAKLTEQMEKVDKEDLQKQNEAKEEAMGERSGRQQEIRWCGQERRPIRAGGRRPSAL